MQVHRGIIVVGVCALAILGESCNSDDAGPQGPGTVLPGSTSSYAECLVAEGIDLSLLEPFEVGREYGPGTVRGSAEFRAADRRCRSASGGEVVGDQPEEVAAKDASALGITECMRDRGWDIADPVRDPVAGYLLPQSPVVPADADQAARQLADLTECGQEFGIGVVGG